MKLYLSYKNFPRWEPGALFQRGSGRNQKKRGKGGKLDLMPLELRREGNKDRENRSGGEGKGRREGSERTWEDAMCFQDVHSIFMQKRLRLIGVSKSSQRCWGTLRSTDCLSISCVTGHTRVCSYCVAYWTILVYFKDKLIFMFSGTELPSGQTGLVELTFSLHFQKNVVILIMQN